MELGRRCSGSGCNRGASDGRVMVVAVALVLRGDIRDAPRSRDGYGYGGLVCLVVWRRLWIWRLYGDTIASRVL